MNRSRSSSRSARRIADFARPVTALATARAIARPLGGGTHASPSVRAFARELGVDLHQVPASGPKGRILKEDVSAFVKRVMQTANTTAPQSASLGGGLDLLPWPKIDFTKFGEIEVTPLSRIKKISGQNLSRNWVMIPAVTYHEDADITDLEAFRVQLNKENEKSGNKLTMLAFLIKACVKAMQRFPEFNASLDGDNLVLKKYFNIGFAADTPNGLVVPVVKNVDQKSVTQIAAECGELAKKAAVEAVGEKNVFDSPRIPASEDFSYYAQVAPTYFMTIGSGDGPANHNPGFKADDGAILNGIKAEVRMILDYLNSK